MKHDSDCLWEHGIYLLMGEIDTESAEDVIRWIIDRNLSTTQLTHLTLMINSWGGEVPAGFAIIDAMLGSNLPIHTVGLGSISSAALLIFMAGTEGHRTLTPNTSILSHQWTWGSYGKEHELIASSKEFELISNRMMRHYKMCTGLSEAEIREKLLPAFDVWLSAKEAKKLRICDAVKELRYDRKVEAKRKKSTST